MTQELLENLDLFLVQKSNQSVCSSCNNAISDKTSSFVVYITSLNLLQNKFEDSISAVILRKRSRLNCNFCKGHSGDVSLLQQFVMPPTFLLVELSDNCIDQHPCPILSNGYDKVNGLTRLVRPVQVVKQ